MPSIVEQVYRSAAQAKNKHTCSLFMSAPGGVGNPDSTEVPKTCVQEVTKR